VWFVKAESDLIVPKLIEQRTAISHKVSVDIRRETYSFLESQMARRELSEPFESFFRLRSVMHEQRQKKNDRKRDTDQPKQSASTKAHDGLHSLCCVINSAVIQKFR
jgi:hypothetical protein